MNHAEKARDLFREGYNCAQSVVGAFHEEMGLSLSEATRLASSFGGGMGGLRETCGAVTGMFLVAGMLMGYDDPADYDGKKAHYARIRQLAEQFRQKHDTLVCRELLRSLPEKLQKDPQPRKTTAAKSTTTKKTAVKPKKTVIRTESAAKPTASVSARKKKATKSESV